MDNGKLLLESRIKRWKRKLKLAHTMLRKYEAALMRFEKRERQASTKLAEEIESATRKFKF